MKVSEYWLKQWLPLTDSAEKIGETLTMLGLELDDIQKQAPEFSGVVIGEVIECIQHPDADRLRVTKVDIGDDQLLQIVCGAPNVCVGMKAPVATIGAVLPSDDNKGFKIKKGKLRGVESHGMLCGASELGLIDEVDGLMALDADAPIGANIREYLALDSHILDIAITPNRGDCLSMLGIARELAVAYNTALTSPAVQCINPNINASQGVQVHAKDACPRYYAQVLHNVDRRTPSPKWLKDALMSSGVRTHNFLVDVTNFVLLELGQPLHAFDADTIVGDIIVRMAQPGESFTLLNEETITLSGDELVIADAAGVLALAGIMGGLRSAVSDTTTNIVLESAHFAPLAITGRARRFGLHTDASQRFERGVDFELPRLALDRAVAIIKTHTHCDVGAVTLVETVQYLPQRNPIHASVAAINARLGINIDKTRMIEILSQLAIQVLDAGDTLICTPPSHRFDLSITEDIAEEVARVYGYDNIPSALPTLGVQMQDDPSATLILKLKNMLVSLGYHEAISFSFSDAKLEALLDDPALGAVLPLANPLSSELAVMRRTLLSSLLPVVQHNLNRKQHHIRLFETGLSFVGETVASLVQTPSLAVVAAGDYYDKGSEKSRAFDFFDLKHDVLSLLPTHMAATRVRCERATLNFLHPGQSAYLLVDDVCIGWFGQLHPSLAKTLDLPVTWVAQLKLEPIITLQNTLPHVHAPSKFPQVRRDFAFLVDNDVAWQTVEQVIYKHAGTLLQDAWLFDIYTGERLPAGKKSLAFTLVWQDHEGTLDDARIKALSDDIIDALTCQLGADLRDS